MKDNIDGFPAGSSKSAALLYKWAGETSYDFDSALVQKQSKQNLLLLTTKIQFLFSIQYKRELSD